MQEMEGDFYILEKVYGDHSVHSTFTKLRYNTCHHTLDFSLEY